MRRLALSYARHAAVLLAVVFALVLFAVPASAQLAPAYPDTPHAPASLVDSIARARTAQLVARCDSAARGNASRSFTCLARSYHASDDTVRQLSARLAFLRGDTTSARRAHGVARLLAAGAIGYGAGQLDPDHGGYRDSWRTPDKREHAYAGAALGSTFGALIGCGVALGYELGQGVFSARDATASCGFAVLTSRESWRVARRGVVRLRRVVVAR